MTPKKLFTVFAIAEAITWTLLVIGLILKYVTQTTETGVRIGGGIHGFVFLTYCVVTVLVGTSQRWPLGRTILGLLSAVIPYATIPFEIDARRRGLLDGEWQLAHGGRTPRNWFERLCAWAIAHPLLAVVVGLLGVALLFTVLLMLGPPIPKG
ncbi:DUF3817 domain-containing protein [Nocardia zapadnayensis]|nr:DUF3817 domain-containing protein [Nocardia zapadnayensis]MCX0277306.1 DUF3817 domain-containing protein [Nocardia zapadnayensis]